MSKNIVHVTIAIGMKDEDDDLNHLSIAVSPKGEVAGNSQLTIHNSTKSHTLSIWASKSNSGHANDSKDLIEGWAQRASDISEIRLQPGERTDKNVLKIKSKNRPFSFWLHVNYGEDVAKGLDGGGLSASAEIVVTP